MESLGFEKAQRHWTHPTSRYWVEFPPGPVAIGEETIRTFAERSRSLARLPRGGIDDDRVELTPSRV